MIYLVSWVLITNKQIQVSRVVDITPENAMEKNWPNGMIFHQPLTFLSDLKGPISLPNPPFGRPGPVRSQILWDQKKDGFWSREKKDIELLGYDGNIMQEGGFMM